MSNSPIEIKSYDRRRTAVIHLDLPRAEIQSQMGPAIHEVMSLLKEQNCPILGSLFARHLSLSSERFDFEVGFEIGADFLAQGRVYESQIPAAKVLECIYQGPYEGLFQAWSNFGSQARAQYAPKEPVVQREIWEVYLRGPESGLAPSQWETQLVIPFEFQEPSAD